MKTHMAVMAGVILAAYGLGAAAADAPPVMYKTASEQIEKARQRCGASAESSACEIRELAAAARIRVNGSMAGASIDSMLKKKTLDKTASKAAADFAAETAPLLEEMRGKATGAAVVNSVADFSKQLHACIAQMSPQPREAGGLYQDRLIACEAAISRTEIAVIAATTGKAPAASFRESSWGDSMSAVIAKEGKPASRAARTLTYEATVGHLVATAIFEFANDHLASAGYVFVERHATPNGYISDYDAISELLRLKYGVTDPTERVWQDDLYKNDRSGWGMAIATGRMHQFELWRNDEAKIDHTLDGDNFRVRHIVRYESLEYAPDLEKVRSAASTKGL